MSNQGKSQFEQAGNREQTGILREFAEFLKMNRKFWLIPLLVALVALGALIILGATAAAPFIYTLF